MNKQQKLEANRICKEILNLHKKLQMINKSKSISYSEKQNKN